MTYITPAEFEDRMRDLKEGSKYSDGSFDAEAFHINADELMVEVLNSLGYEKGCDIFNSTERWYS